MHEILNTKLCNGIKNNNHDNKNKFNKIHKIIQIADNLN